MTVTIRDAAPLKETPFVRGLPVVGTDVACVRAVIDPGVNGLVVPPADPAALAASLTALLTDADTWRRLAAAGLASVRERLGWDRAAEATQHVYAAVLGAVSQPAGR